jgi:hypothetical protein
MNISRGTLVVIAGFLIGVLGTARNVHAAADDNVTRIYAVYDVSFAGFGLGKFKFWANTNPNGYSMSSRTKISLMNGMLFEWSGRTSSSGSLHKSRPVPIYYSFDFKSKKKRGMVRLKFANGSIDNISIAPAKKPSRTRIPVKKQHLKGVFDPMGALMLLSASNSSPRSACQRKIPVFDGRQRFDLQLSYKDEKMLERGDTGGYSGKVIICKVKYKPIAGYKPGKKVTVYMEENEEIEVWLIPMSDTKMYVPYRIEMPTPVGRASMQSVHFQVDHPGGRRIALIKH